MNLRKHPFWGIYAEVATELGITRQAVRQAAQKGSPRILKLINKKRRDRLNAVQTHEQLLREAA